MVFLIMDRVLPDLYFHLGGTHVHHLNYGIFLLSGVGGYVLVAKPASKAHHICTVIYAVGLALTFDEFGMWLHLGGPYWQRASFDAVVMISATLALLAYAPELQSWSLQKWIKAALLCGMLATFGVTFAGSLKHAEEIISVKLRSIESDSPN